MDQVAQVGGIAGLMSLVIHGVQQLMTMINHKRIRSQCCGRNLGDTVIDVTDTTPPPMKNISGTVDVQ
jgi:hypothetical protein